MWKLRAFAVAGSVVFALATGTAAWATKGGNSHSSSSSNSSGGDANKGDVWVDNVGQPAGPGHEMDPHLACSDINLWGNGLADSSGSYTIDGWSPSGKKGQAYSSTWSYPGSGTQIIDVINVTTLINNAVANGDKPKNKQGYHFKLQFSQDPQKHKTFWVKCPAPTSTPTSPSTPPTTTTTTTSSTSPSTTTTTTTTAPTSAVKGTTTHKKKRRRKRHVRAKRVSRRPRVSSGFTG
jgi:hypothetical protein